MTTEKEIVYSILNSLRGSHSDNNEMISERLIRSWVNTERANILLQFTDAGRSISEENYQDILLNVNKTGDSISNIYYQKIPKIIFFNKRTGVRIIHKSNTVLMCTKSQHRHYSKNEYTKNLDRTWIIGNKMFFYLKNGTENTEELDINAVLYNPSDQEEYDWETSPYPLQSELITVLKTVVLEKNSGIINPGLNDNDNNFKQDYSNEKS